MHARTHACVTLKQPFEVEEWVVECFFFIDVMLQVQEDTHTYTLPLTGG